MIISRFKQQETQIGATIEWESASKEPFDAYLRYEGEADRIRMGQSIAHPFLITAVLPAMRHGEKRVRVRGESVDPFLLDQLRSVSALAHAWWGDGAQYEPVKIESEAAEDVDPSWEDRVAASFLTGGVDSLATLRNNRLNIPRSHPKSIEKNILVYGIDIGLGGRASEGEEVSKRKFQETCQALSPITTSAGTELIPVYTNFRYLDDDNDFYTQKWHGSLLAAVAHALAGSIHTVYIGSTFDYENAALWGSTPLMDPMFSGPSLRIKHDGARFSRLDKVRLLASWPEALDSVRVCLVNPPGELNCGRCEKCIRTKLELAAVDKLDESGAFDDTHISSDWIDQELQIQSPFAAVCYKEILEPLRKQNQGTVANAVEAKLQRYRAMRRRVEERDWRGVIKRGLRALNLYR